MKILQINSSANKESSVSRSQVKHIVSKIKDKDTSAEIIDRDVAYSDLPFVNQEFVETMFYKGELNEKQKEILAVSDVLVDEVLASDVLVIGAPMYNYSVPASLKAYFDLIARQGKTFQYEESGSITGFLKDKTVIVVIATGGTPIGSPMDHSTDYITTFLGFLGVTDIHFIELDQVGVKGKEKLTEAEVKVDSIVGSL